MKHSFLVPPSIAPGILEDLLAWKLSSGFKLEGVYKTTEDDGKDFFTVRCKNPSSGQKYFSDVYFNDSEQAWKLAAPSERWRDGKPLYGRHVLETQVGEPVIVVEGQHKVDALLRLGIRAVTSGGASTLETASRQDIEALCSNNIIVWQDNDEPGRRWYQSLLEAFSKSPVRPRLVERIKHEYLDLPEGGDVVDWVQRYPDAQAEDVLALERQVVPLRTAETLPLPTSFDPLPFPIECLTYPFNGAGKIAQLIGAAPEMVALDMIASAAVAVQGHANVVPTWGRNPRPIPLNLYVLIVAQSGERKSASRDLVERPHKELQTRLARESEPDIKSYRLQLEVYEAKRKQYLRKIVGKEEDTFAQKLKQLEKPIEPRRPTVLIGRDTTIEAIPGIVANSRLSLGWFVDEASAFFGGYSMRAENRGANVAHINDWWTQGGVSAPNRVTRQVERIGENRLTLSLSIQPAILDRHLQDSTFDDIGLLARFLLTCPKPLAGTRTIRQEGAEDLREYRDFCDGIRRLNAMSLPILEGNLCPRNLPLRPHSDADRAWRDFANQVESKLGEEGELQSIAGAASKAAEQVLRLAAIFTLFSDPGSAEVAQDSMVAAINLVQYNLDQHRLRYGRGGGASSEGKARLLLTWLVDKRINEFSLRDVMTSGPHAAGVRKKKEIAEKLLRVLADSGYIEEVQGRQKIRRYRLITSFTDVTEGDL